jgi:tripartite-type tricarboxylate transporter receptor subunit TctC
MRIAPWFIAPLLALASMAAHAQDFPSKPVKIIVGVGAGSVADVRARWIAQRLSPLLGQPVIVENKVGASGSIAAEFVARSAPDGHTLLFATTATVVVPEVYPAAAFDPIRDFAPITRLSQGYQVLTVSPTLPVKSVADLVTLARAKPGQLNYGSTGIGGPPWLSAEVFRQVGHIDVTHVPYKGGADLMNDLMAGRLDYWFESALIQLPYIQSGRLRALAVTGPRRLASLPEVPTMREAGLPEYDMQVWTGILAPAATPRAVVNRLNADFRKVLASAETIELITQGGGEVVLESPEEFALFMRAERERLAPIVRAAAVKSQL